MPDEPARIENAREAFAAEVAALIERQRTAHLRVACPRCGASKGSRCQRVISVPHGGGAYRTGAALKHSHRERLRADGIPDR